MPPEPRPRRRPRFCLNYTPRTTWGAQSPHRGTHSLSARARSPPLASVLQEGWERAPFRYARRRGSLSTAPQHGTGGIAAPSRQPPNLFSSPKWFWVGQVCKGVCMCAGVCLCISHSVMSDSLRPRGPNLARLPCPWNSPGQNTGVGSRSLLQVIFPTQGSNQGLLHCRWILYQLSYQGSPKKKIKGSVSHIETE